MSQKTESDPPTTNPPDSLARVKRSPGDRPPKTRSASGTASKDDTGDNTPSELAKCERVIKEYQDAQLEAARAMRKITEEKLHRERGFESIEDYARSKFGFSKARWYQLVDYARVHDQIESRLKMSKDEGSGDGIPLPQMESQARPLAKFEGAEILTEIWKEVTSRCDSLTRKNVKTAVGEITSEDSGSDGDEDEDADGENPDGENPGAENPGNGNPGSENPDGEGSGHPGGENPSGSGTETELEEARRRLEDIPEGIADDLQNIAAAAVDGWTETAESLEGAISRYEDTYSENGDSVLVAIPWTMLATELESASELAKNAVPLPAAETQNEVGVLLSDFDGSPPLGKIQDGYQNRAESSCAECPAGRWADYVSNLTGGALSGHHRGLDQDGSETEGPKSDREWGSELPPILFPGRLGDLRSLSGSEDTADSDVNVAISTGLFNEQVPGWMIQSAFSAADENASDVLFETAPGQDLSQIDFPKGARLGVTVSSQEEVGLAEAQACKSDADATWLLCRAVDTLQIEDPSVFDAIEINALKEKTPVV